MRILRNDNKILYRAVRTLSSETPWNHGTHYASHANIITMHTVNRVREIQLNRLKRVQRYHVCYDNTRMRTRQWVFIVFVMAVAERNAVIEVSTTFRAQVSTSVEYFISFS